MVSRERAPGFGILLLLGATGGCTQFKDDTGTPTIDSTLPEAGPPCDPSEPFGAALPVPGLEDGGANAVAGVRLTPDLLTAYFAADGRPDSLGGYDLYVATRARTTDPLEDIAPVVGARINSYRNEMDPSVSGNGLSLAFATSELDLMATALWYSARALPSVPFSGVDHALGPGDAGGYYYDTNPYLRENGQVLYFSSNRDPGDGDDIFLARWNGSQFGPPEPVNGINTYYSEVYPVVTPDDLQIYFASDRMAGAGQFAMYLATRGSATQPFTVLRAISELYSGKSDFPSFVSRDGCSLYFTSLRNGNPAAYFATKRP
jgi:hypothetical protein